MDAGDSLVVQQLRLSDSTAGGAVLIPGPGTKILHAAQHSQKFFFLMNNMKTLSAFSLSFSHMSLL